MASIASWLPQVGAACQTSNPPPRSSPKVREERHCFHLQVAEMLPA
jgi:hypothetical protein